MAHSQVSSFYKNETIFITGGIGFVGKVLIEKLLRTCPDIKTVFLLIRAKKNKTPHERFQEAFSFKCFEQIIKSQVASKIKILDGDCTLPNLGLNQASYELLIEETTCFIHAASSVKMNLDFAGAIPNVIGTENVVKLAMNMKNLKVFTFVSTAYSNFPESYIEEKFYEPPLSLQELYKIAKGCDEEKAKKYLGKWPNTYVFCKNITENYLKNANLPVPVVIVRPSIITSALKEPVEGWIDNAYGYMGVVLYAQLGLLNVLVAKKSVLHYLVPVDIVANCILAAIWKEATRKSKIPVIYNCVGNSFSYSESEKYMTICHQLYPSEKCLWYPYLFLTESVLFYKFVVFWKLLPIYFIEFLFFCCKKPVRLIGKYKTINKSISCLFPFTTNEWKFDEANMLNLWEEMSETDRELFYFIDSNFNWYLYIRQCFLGVRQYLLKDPIETLPKSKKKCRRLFASHIFVLIIQGMIVLAFLMMLLKLF